MNFDRRMREEINKIDVPDELLPENIAEMLRSVPKTESGRQTVMNVSRPARRISIMRVTAAAAACMAIGSGVLLYSDMNNEPAELVKPIEYKDVKQTGSYDDLYDVYTSIHLSADNTDNTAFALPDESQTDIVKSENGVVYFVSGGKIYSITENGASLCADIGSKQPLEMYVSDDKLVLISEEPFSADSSAQSINESDVPAKDINTAGENAPDLLSDEDSIISMGVTADIYGIENGSAQFLGEYRQSGEYVSSRISDGTLCVVTSYNSGASPVETETDLKNYVPYYELDSKGHFVAAEDITIPANANSTDYTVVSAVNIHSRTASVKALLGSTRKVYCPDDTLYIAGVGSSADDTPYTIVTSFALGSSIEYIASGSVEGTLLGSMNEYDGTLRLATSNTAENGSPCTDIYVLDRDMSVINSAGQLLSGKNITSVVFTDRYASLYRYKTTTSEMVIDLSAKPPVVADDMISENVSSLYSYSDGMLLGFGTSVADIGDNRPVLTMFDAETGSVISRTEFEEHGLIKSPAIESRRALMFDAEQGLIGVPVTSLDGKSGWYYLFSYDDDSGFTQIGRAEYSTPDEGFSFRQAVVSGNMLYIITDERIVMARTSDMSIVKVFRINR